MRPSLKWWPRLKLNKSHTAYTCRSRTLLLPGMSINSNRPVIERQPGEKGLILFSGIALIGLLVMMSLRPKLGIGPLTCQSQFIYI